MNKFPTEIHQANKASLGKLSKTFAHTLLACASLAIGTFSAKAASVTWDTAQNITAPSDVLNTGTFDRAYSFQSGTNPIDVNPVNGITFYGVGANPLSPPESLTFGNTTLASTTEAIPLANAPTDMTLQYGFMMQNGFYAPIGGFTLTLNGLTLGQDYRIQLWGNYQSGSGKIQTIASGNSGTLNASVGQYLVGNFTADGSPQVFNISSADNFPIVNAISLYAVPEPTTWAMLVGGIGAMLLISRRRQA